MQPQHPQPGWYPDPSGAPGLRYWDGSLWGPPAADAPAVPDATRPAPKKSSPWKVVTAVVGALIFMTVIGNALGDDKKPSASSPNASARSAPLMSSPAPTETAAPAGASVRDGKFEFQVINIARSTTVSDPTGNPYMTATAQGEFIVVTLSVKNIGNEPQSYFGQNQQLIDASGREYGASSEADTWMNAGGNPMGDINPGNSIQVKVAFDVPPGTNPAELELHDSMFSGGVSVRLA
jgi:Domain of unknown function (DUF4352)/Protein of unknown function (DUF2510)